VLIDSNKNLSVATRIFIERPPFYPFYREWKETAESRADWQK